MTREPIGRPRMAVTSHRIAPVPGAWQLALQRMGLVPGSYGTVTGVQLHMAGAEVTSYVFDPPVEVPPGATLEILGLGEGTMHFRVDGHDELRRLLPEVGEGTDDGCC